MKFNFKKTPANIAGVFCIQRPAWHKTRAVDLYFLWAQKRFAGVSNKTKL
jgi:hypothetical protein